MATPPLTNTLHTLSARGLPLLPATPLNPHAPIAKWLLTNSALVLSMIHIGGITRLTKSGLSMTDWKPLGSLPPLSQREWEDEFERYKTFPEWEQRKSMTLDEFKYIFYWEWGHRMLGRVVGVAFVGPWVYFSWMHRPNLAASGVAAATGGGGSASSSLFASLVPRMPLTASSTIVPPRYQPRLALLCAMGGTQGLVGWWMVKSGLGDDRRGDRREIRVSPYRLAAHLTMAVGTYSLLTWTGLNVLSYPVDEFAVKNAATAATNAATTATTTITTTTNGPSLLRQYAKSLSLSPSSLRHAKTLRTGTLHTIALTGLTIVSGAFVAGNDAGNAYNTYPLMDDRFVPWEDMVDPELHPKYRNLFETTATVQFNHRVLGTTTALSALGLAAYGLFHPAGRAAAATTLTSQRLSTAAVVPSTTPQVRRGLVALGTAATAQMSLGIATLLNYVPIHLAAAHQLGSLVVLSCGIYTAHSLRYAGRGVLKSVAGSGVSAVAGNVAKGIGGGSGGGVIGKGSAVVSKVATKLRL
ncbi:hypothetical protein ACHAXS_011158 [Conticribra weissflogii]